MNAVVVLPEVIPALCGLDARVPSPLLRLTDRPYLQHIVEYLASFNIREFDFVVSEHPEMIEEYFGGGTRWGCHFRFHLTRRAAIPAALISNLISSYGQPVIVAHADRFPLAPLDSSRGSKRLAVYTVSERDASARLAGWAGLLYIPAESPDARTLHGDYSRLEAIVAEMAARGTIDVMEAKHSVGIQTPEMILRTQHALLKQELPGMLIGGRPADPGIWLARNVTLHPSAEITAPVYVGQNCRIEKGARIGPNAVLSDNCVVDRDSTIRDSLILPGSYVGQALEVENSIVDRNFLVNLSLNTGVFVSESFLLGALASSLRTGGLRRVLSRVSAGIVFLFLLPIFAVAALLMYISGKGSLARIRIVSAPASPGAVESKTFSMLKLTPTRQASAARTGWKALLCDFIPGLLSVARGDLAFVGLVPRTADELDRLPPAWQSLYRSSRAGLISEAAVMTDVSGSDEQLYLAEAYYRVSKSFTHDVRLAFLYFARLFTKFKAPARVFKLG